MSYPTIKVVSSPYALPDNVAGPVFTPKVVVSQAPTQPPLQVKPLPPQPKLTVTKAQSQPIKASKLPTDTRPITVSGASPFQKKPTTVGSAAQSYWKLLTEPFVKTNKVSFGLARDIVQGTARTASSLLITPPSMFSGESKSSKYTLHNDTLFGKGKAVEPLTVFAMNNYLKAREFGQQKGLDNAGATSLGLGYAALSVGGSLLDFTPGGKADDAAKQLAKTDDVAKIIKTLTKSGVVDDVAKDYAPIIAKATDPAEVKQILGQISRVSKQVDPLIQEARKYKSAEEFVKAQQPRVGGIAPELKGETLYRGMSESEWKAIQDGGLSGKRGDGRTYLTTEKETAQMAVDEGVKSGKGEGVIVELKPEAGQKVISGGKIGENTGGNLRGEYQGKDIGIDDIARVTDSKGNVIYEASTGGKTKSQLTDIWNKANKEKVDNNLISEARKYKSAEEFVKAQKPLFRGATPENMLKDKGRGISFATDKEVAKRFSTQDLNGFPQKGEVGEFYLKPNAKILDPDTITAQSMKMDKTRENIMKYARDNGYDAVDLTRVIDPKSGFKPENELRIINKDALKTKSQLTDIWNKANSVGKIDPRSGVKNLNITDDAYKVIDDNAEALRPKLEKLKGSPMTAEEVKDAAIKSDVMKKVVTREESLRNVAQVQKTRESIAALAEGRGVKKEFAEQLLALKSQMSDTARKLRAAGFGADAVEVNSKADIVNRLTEAGVEIDEIVKAAETVDFDNPNQVAKLYRKFIKPSFVEKLDEWRYGNMLSSPLTHLVNITSNAIQATVLNPATKLASGLIDNVASKLIGKEQEHFIREVPQVYRGMFNSFGEALNNSWQVYRGNKALRRLDINRIPSGSKITAVQRQFLQALEAGDAFFRTLVKGGEMEALASKYTKMGKKFTQETLEKEADGIADYFTFRKGLDSANKEGQGALLSGIDGLTGLVMKGRDLPFVGKPIGWFVPFVQIPMNILKQGVEYSPIGILTLPKNANKVEQLGKAMVGSTVFAGAGYLALNNRTTWGAPTNEKEKELFYASDMQPYSVKIGDKWFSYSKIGPLAYPVAMAAAIKHYWKDNPKSVDQNTGEKLTQILGGVAKFFGDQSYIQGISELGGIFQGQSASSLIKTIENMGGQGIPFSGLQRWVNNVIDPVFRKTESKLDVDNILKNLQAQLVTQSDIQEPYTKPDGTESKRPFPFINAINPFKVTKEDPSFKEEYNLNNELQKLGIQKKSNDEEDKMRITPILDHVTELEKQGKMDEAQQIKDSLSEEDWNTYKKIRQTRRDTEVANTKPQMLEVYKKVTYLESIGQLEEAQRIKDELTEEEWSAYKAVRNLAEGAKE